MRRCSVWMRRRRFKRWTARIRCCHSRRDAPSGTASSTFDTLPLYAAFDTKTGEVLGKTAARHTSAEFVAFLADIVVNQPRVPRRVRSIPRRFPFPHCLGCGIIPHTVHLSFKYHLLRGGIGERPSMEFHGTRRRISPLRAGFGKPE